VLISVVQYHEALESGALDSAALIPVARRLGADGIELRDTYWRDQAREIAECRRLLDAEGLVVTYATGSTLFGTRAEALHRHVDDAVALGSPLVRVFHGNPPTLGDRAGWDAAIAAVEYARGAGVVIALENLWKGAGRTAAEILSTLDAVPGLCTNVDVGNYQIAGENVATAVRTLGERVVYTQLKDYAGDPDGTFLGGGQMPLGDILDALDALPQRIPYCFEFVGGGEPELRITRSLDFLRARAR
jgi:sugar phosphate isomerase/epimerase